MVIVRKLETIYQAEGKIQHGTFHGRWHFSFDQYHDPEYMRFGTLRVFNDDTLSPGAVWPLHPHREIEVVTYCADGEFRHEDEHGKGGVLRKGWVQHTTVGRGMYHSEINNRQDTPMRFIQMWFMPSQHGLEPFVEQKAVERADRTHRFLPLVSSRHKTALSLSSDAAVFSCFLEKNKQVQYMLEADRGGYLYVLEGGPIVVNEDTVPPLGVAKVSEERQLIIEAVEDSELLLVDVRLA